MAQTWTDDVFASGHVAQTDLQNMENNFTCLKSSFSGTGAPSNPVAGMVWFDTTAAKRSMKQRDAANSAWIGIMHGDANQKMWVYRDSAMDGWTVDSSVTDKVLAIKGGSTYTTGGTSNTGSWTISGLSSSTPTFSGSVSVVDAAAMAHSVGRTSPMPAAEAGSTPVNTISDHGAHGHSASVSGSVSTPSISAGSAWRPAASVGTLQYITL